MVESRYMNIYTEMKKPIFSLAPMEDVTDSVFRQVVSTASKPTLFYTEFVNVEGLNSKGKERVIHRLEYDKKEKPIVAQLWGITPLNFYKAAKLVKKLGFDGVDINMGCSVKKVVQKNAGSGLIQEERGRVKEIIEAVKEGSKGLPVSVKTRLGWDEYDMDWIKFLLEQDLDALTIHGRTARGKGILNANWEKISECVDMRDEMKKDTLIFGNGDIHSLKQAKEYYKKYKVDGVMIGRAAITNPWIFSGKENISQEERYILFKKHLELFNTVWGERKNFSQLKKFFRAYIYGFDGANEIRSEFMKCNSVKECMDILLPLFKI